MCKMGQMLESTGITQEVHVESLIKRNRKCDVIDKL